MIKLFIPLLVFISSFSSYAMPLEGRLGVGMTNQVVTGIEAISLKLQRTRGTAIGALLGVDSNNEKSNYAIGAKVYKLIYDEPQLNFYSSLAAISFTYQDDLEKTKNGYQVDGTFGAEFSFSGLESLGFSFEFGVSMNRYKEKSNLKTIGRNFLMSAVHFYL